MAQYPETQVGPDFMAMSHVLVRYRSLVGPVAVILLVAVAILWSPFEPHRPPVAAVPTWDDADWAVFEEKVGWAASQRLDTVGIGEAMAALGRTFVGTTYVPQTLEVEGPEGLVINFRGLDCVTFVENVLALSRFVRTLGTEALADRAAAEDAYEALLAQIRYRGGIIDGYPSRLHYFTDWIADNARRGLVRDITGELGGVRDAEPVDFMTTHTEAYRQLSDPTNVVQIRATEEAITARGRVYVPQERIADVAAGIRDGDIIAATSTVAGLDVAHTGIALWVDGSLRLMHAPLVGDSVQISEITLAERIQGIAGQDGIIVARATDR